MLELRTCAIRVCILKDKIKALYWECGGRPRSQDKQVGDGDGEERAASASEGAVKLPDGFYYDSMLAMPARWNELGTRKKYVLSKEVCLSMKSTLPNRPTCPTFVTNLSPHQIWGME